MDLLVSYLLIGVCCRVVLKRLFIWCINLLLCWLVCKMCFLSSTKRRTLIQIVTSTRKKSRINNKGRKKKHNLITKNILWQPAWVYHCHVNKINRKKFTGFFFHCKRKKMFVFNFAGFFLVRRLQSFRGTYKRTHTHNK